MPRTKTVTLDGASFVIAPLTIEQVEEYVRPLDGGDYKVRLYDLLCMGLNNAPVQNGDAPWTADRIRKELDLVILGLLQSEILSFSGLKLVEPSPGEAPSPAS